MERNEKLQLISYTIICLAFYFTFASLLMV